MSFTNQLLADLDIETHLTYDREGQVMLNGLRKVIFMESEFCKDLSKNGLNLVEQMKRDRSRKQQSLAVKRKPKKADISMCETYRNVLISVAENFSQLIFVRLKA